MKNKVKVVCLYQVIMHYRLSFYQKISEDPDIDFTIIYGRGKKNTKLINTTTENINFKHRNIKF